MQNSITICLSFTDNAEEAILFLLNAKNSLLSMADYFGRFHESKSLYVSCDNQEQIDMLYMMRLL